MVTYVYKSPEGSVYQTTGASKESLEKMVGKDLTDSEYKEIIKSTCTPAEGCEVIEIDPQDLPDEDLFPCWEIVGKEVKINSEKLKEWALRRVRSIRTNALAILDVEATRAIEDDNKDTLSKVKEKKNQLRDLTEEIKALDWPQHACKDTLKRFRELIDNSRIQEILQNGEGNQH